MPAQPPNDATLVGRAPYRVPRLDRLGSAVELTKDRRPVGAKDGGANNTRTG